MQQKEDSNLVKARSSIVWIAAILTAFAVVWWIEKESGKELIERQAQQKAAATAAAPAASSPGSGAPQLVASANLPAQPAPRALTEQERQWARTAWKYFENNTDATTGLTASVDGFPSGTMWDMSSALMALIAARDLEIIDAATFDARMALALQSLAKLPLYANALPNKSYDIRSLAMTDYENKPTAAGIGWSAIDIGRLLVPLNIIAWHHPKHTPAARAVIGRWNTAQIAREGQLFTMSVEPNAPPKPLQEGRLGYEQYAARTLALMGVDVDVALDWRAFLRLVDVEGVQVCVDSRDPKQFGAQNFLTSDPFIMLGLELGFSRHGAECAWRAYQAQEARFKKTGVLTAVTEDHIDQAPFFLYNSIHVGGRNWATVTEKGDDAAALRTLSTKAAFGWHALYATEYTGKLVAAVAALHDPAKGWYAGLYEEGARPNKVLTANTNGMVLESLAFIARGRLLNYR